MDWLSLIVSYSWSSQVETAQELTSLAGKLNLCGLVVSYVLIGTWRTTQENRTTTISYGSGLG